MRAGGEIRDALNRAAGTTLLYHADGSAARTGAQLLQRAESLAGALVRNGLREATVGLFYRNSAAAMEAFIATELIGATRLPVEPSAPPAEAAAIYAAAGVDAVLADHGVPGLTAPVLVHTDADPLNGPRWTTGVEVDPERTLVLYPRAVRDGTLFAIPTSYRNWQAIMRVNQELYRRGGYGEPLGEGERLLTMLQLMHVTGLVAGFPFLLMGRPQVLMDRFNAEAAAGLIRAQDITTVFAVPGMLDRIVARPGAFPSLRRVLYGGAPVSSDQIARYARVFGPVLSQLYGRYEAGWPLAVLTPADHERIRRGEPDLAGSCGRPIDGVDLEPRPAAGGEVRVRSAMTSPLFTGPDGWCGVGDTAVRDRHGYLRLTGRLDAMINTGAFHVYPAEVEAAVRALPQIADARVVGEPDPVWGEIVVAYVVARAPVTLEALRDRLRASLAPYKIPRAVRVVDRLPHAPAP
ncbi:fatty acid--CoA ligase family protein [Actinoplanes sp. NPDC051411]|uniref:class I adenylate-forming enzyme family protein n=1 Tax=Actinoplanes sp. NPDC051411 TaxID=3155522 RepID=UPI0034165D56